MCVLGVVVVLVCVCVRVLVCEVCGWGLVGC